eukprot:TRINITY_DN6365_c5_g1_i1.p1 TRINITY_DN6365_c5_g1~~TRINITY_DN6365_c5_g1_i1.p1  ORF type:complete len:604 (+),score=189.00 TRINITY_DN6365_c5_g1_i1:77-1813(+)
MAVAAVAALAAAASPPPMVTTPLGTVVGVNAADGVERYGGIPYAVPPLGARRFGRSEVSTQPFGSLDATRFGPPCIQNPAGDPRDDESDSPPPSEDCLHLNIWRPANATPASRLPVLVYQFGGGLCSGFAGNNYFNGSKMAARHNVIFVTVSYRLGALGYMVGQDAARPGTGGLNGVYDNIVALQWLNKYVEYFGGDPAEITVSGQSSGAYSLCTMCVAPAAKGLFKRAVLNSGPCFGGPTGRGWGPQPDEKGSLVTKKILAALNATSIDDLRKLPAEQIQWPAEYMNDLDKAPYFSGYFVDHAVVPEDTQALWKAGEINPEELVISFTSKDGTGAFYGTAPTLGLVVPDVNKNNPAGYKSTMDFVWGNTSASVMGQYPLSSYPSAPAAFVQADADAYVICPSRRMVRYAAAAGRRVFSSEFAHFQPSPTMPKGCSGWGATGCAGWGCDNGVELDVVPGHRTEETKGWASHGSAYHFAFGTEKGPDGLGPPNNVTYCGFDADEQQLSDWLMAYWASFARHGDTNVAKAAGAPAWPAVPKDLSSLPVMKLSVEATDGVPTKVTDGIHTADCDYWDAAYP